MIEQILLYAGGFLPTAWGIAHLFPTKSVVNGFGAISADSRRIITMEWIIEGVALIFVGVLIGIVTYVDFESVVSQVVYWLVAAFLVTLSLISMMTGAKIRFLPFRLCPVVFLSATLLILLGTLL